jgi:hypothetical protein
VNNKKSEKSKKTHTFPSKKLIWYKTKVLLGTPWVLEKKKKTENSLGIQWDHGGNTSRTRKIQCPLYPFKRSSHNVFVYLQNIFKKMI